MNRFLMCFCDIKEKYNMKQSWTLKLHKLEKMKAH